MIKLIFIISIATALSAETFVEWVYTVKKIKIEFKYGAWFTNLERQDPLKPIGIATANYPAIYGTAYLIFKPEPIVVFPSAHLTNRSEVMINYGIEAIEVKMPVNSKYGLYAEMVLFRRPYKTQPDRNIGIVNNYSKNDQDGVDYVTLPVKWRVVE